MLFAAGLGTRLRPLTNEIPKALVPVGGEPMLGRVARRVAEAGADRIVVNVHHHMDQIERFLDGNDFGVEVVISVEEAHPLETGGGLQKAAHLFHGDRPIVIHNTDVLTDFPLADMLAAHEARDALATLAVMHREDKSRALVFDDAGLLGAVDREGEESRVREAVGDVDYLGFCGVHAVSPALLDRFTESGVFSIIHPYLRLAGAGERILPHAVDGWTWIDIGTPERLEEADAWAAQTEPAGAGERGTPEV